jgi:glycosyltransferase involved in cell wall biosynthesis
MDKRKKIGLIFSFDAHWTGGQYYLLNIIHALNLLPAQEKPELVIFTSGEPLPVLSYPHVKTLPLKKMPSLGERIAHRLRRILDRSVRLRPAYPQQTVDFVFPCTSAAFIYASSLRKLRKVFWIADFQHKYLPHFFSAEEIRARDEDFQRMADLPDALVLSSQDAKADYNKFYPANRNIVRVIPFASCLPPFAHLDTDALMKKYGIKTRYFISPNQFWAHKNHMVILKAALLLRKRGDFQIVFTGNEKDYRNPGYTQSLKQFVTDQGLSETVRFLGFIDRADQLQLMNKSIAVIQPSLFEGWSTVVEDAKAMNKSLILSNLNVHREQCGDTAEYFAPLDETALAGILEQRLSGSGNTAVSTAPYEEKIREFAAQINNL